MLKKSKTIHPLILMFLSALCTQEKSEKVTNTQKFLADTVEVKTLSNHEIYSHIGHHNAFNLLFPTILTQKITVVRKEISSRFNRRIYIRNHGGDQYAFSPFCWYLLFTLSPFAVPRERLKSIHERKRLKNNNISIQ